MMMIVVVMMVVVAAAVVTAIKNMMTVMKRKVPFIIPSSIPKERDWLNNPLGTLPHPSPEKA